MNEKLEGRRLCGGEMYNFHNTHVLEIKKISSTKLKKIKKENNVASCHPRQGTHLSCVQSSDPGRFETVKE